MSTDGLVMPVASFTKEVNPRLAKCPLKTNGRLANRGLTSLVKEATGVITGHGIGLVLLGYSSSNTIRINYNN